MQILKRKNYDREKLKELFLYKKKTSHDISFEINQTNYSKNKEFQKDLRELCILSYNLHIIKKKRIQ